MSSTKALVQLRNDIGEVYRNSITSAGNRALSMADILQSIKLELQTKIKAVESELIDLTLTSFIHDVGRRKEQSSIGTEERDLFDGYKRIPQSVTIDGSRKKRTAQLSIAEAEAYLEEHSLKVASDQHQEFRRLIEDCREFRKSENDTLEVLIQRRSAADGGLR